MNIFQKTKAMLRLWTAVRRADKAHKKDGQRYYVMPMDTKDCKLVIMDRKNFRKLKQKRYMHNVLSVGAIELFCFYCTPYKNGNGKLTSNELKIKSMAYYQWVDKTIKKNRDEKKVRKHRRSADTHK